MSRRTSIAQESAVADLMDSPMSSAPPDDRERLTAMQGPVGAPVETRMERVARRAHEIYEARGGQHGKALEDWLQAEREIDGSL